MHIYVPPDGDLQGALHDAQGGDRIVLSAGATYEGNFVLPRHSDDQPITLTGENPPDARCEEHAGLPTLVPLPNGLPALSTEPGAHDWQIVGLGVQAPAGGYGDLVCLGDGSAAQATREAMPFNLLLDRCAISGDPTHGAKRGISLQAGRTTIRGCRIAGIFTKGQDSQAIAGWNGSGEWTIEDNYLEAASENLLIGGATIHVDGLLPTTIVIRRNTFTKQRAWEGQGLVVKNLLELKTGLHVLVDDNDFSECWADGQVGIAWQVTVRNEEGSNPWASIRHVSFTRNRVWNVGGVLNVLGHDDRGVPSGLLTALLVRDNVAWAVRDGGGAAGRAWQIQGGDWVLLDHNTFLTDQRGDWMITQYLVNAACTHLGVTNNIGIQAPSWGAFLKSAHDTPELNGLVGTAALDAFALPWVYTHNVIVGAPADGTYPEGNYVPPTLDDVGFEDLAGGNYRLSAASPYKGQASDGTDIGARFEQAPAPAED